MTKLLTAYDRSRVSLYLQVASVLRERIHSGQWAAGEKISTLEELESEFQVARVTVRQAVEVLREEGLLQTRQGRGTFVSAKLQSRLWVKLANNWNSQIETLRNNVPRRLSLEMSAPTPNLDAGEGVPAASYVRLQSVQYRNDEPYSSANVLLARRVFDLDPTHFKSAAALVVLDSLEGVTLRDAHQTLTVGSADPVIADTLKVPIGAAIVNAHCVVVDDEGVAIYVGDIVYRSDSIKLQVNLLEGADLTRRPGRSAGKTEKADKAGSRPSAKARAR